MKFLQGKVVAVTGGASGIGRVICIAVAQYGAKAVVIVDVRKNPAEGGPDTVDEVVSRGAIARFQHTDVSRPTDIEALFEVTSQLGGVDVMVCNAGIVSPNDGPDLSESDYRQLMSINLDGVYYSARGAGNQMKAAGKRGSIVMTSSMGGLRGSAFAVAYSAAKAGVCLMAKSLADAYGPFGIRVNAVCPGIIATQLVNSSSAVAALIAPLVARTPLRRMGRPDEVADVVAWLGSDLSSFVTGANILIDGGLSSVI